MHRKSVISIAQVDHNLLERIWLASAGWEDVRTRRGRRHADRRVGVIIKDVDLRTRLAWDAALDALGIYRSALCSLDELIEAPKVVEEELDLVIVADPVPHRVDRVAQTISIPVLNAGSHNSEPARAIAESLLLLKHKSKLDDLTLLMVKDDSPIVRSWAQIAALYKMRFIQLANYRGGLPVEMRGVQGSGFIEVVEVGIAEKRKAFSELTKYVEAVRIDNVTQRLSIPKHVFCITSGTSECDRLIAPVCAALLEHALK